MLNGGISRSPGPVIALVVLMILAAVALRGHLPGPQPETPGPPAEGGASSVAVVALLTVSITIIAMGILASMRQRNQAARPQPRDLTELLGSGPARPPWRALVIGLGVLVAWVLLVVVLTRLAAPDIDQPASSPPPDTAPGADSTGPTPAAPPPDSSDPMFGYLVAATLVMLVLLVVGMAVAMRRRLPPRSELVADDGSEPESPPQALALAAERGLAEIADSSRDPRAAIIACYAAMEQALERAPDAAPRESDTPSEVLARAVEHHALPADSATELVALFAEARFSPHVMTEEHRGAAVRSLRIVLDELRAPA